MPKHTRRILCLLSWCDMSEHSSLDEDLARLDERIQRLEKHVTPLPVPKSKAPFLLKCPLCAADMEAGTITVNDTFLSLAMFGLGFQACRFQPEGDKPEEVVVPS